MRMQAIPRWHALGRAMSTADGRPLGGGRATHSVLIKKAAQAVNVAAVLPFLLSTRSHLTHHPLPLMRKTMWTAMPAALETQSRL